MHTDFMPDIDAAFGALSADKLAELRARRLLLNENLPDPNSSNINEVTRDLFIGGQATALRIERSPFPAIFNAFGKDPRKFLEIAWIAAAAELKLSNSVADISLLRLTLVTGGLFVSFRGRRKKVLQNAAPSEISVDGLCRFETDVSHSAATADLDSMGSRLRNLSSKISFVRVPQNVAARIVALVSELEALLAGLPPR